MNNCMWKLTVWKMYLNRWWLYLVFYTTVFNSYTNKHVSGPLFFECHMINLASLIAHQVNCIWLSYMINLVISNFTNCVSGHWTCSLDQLKNILGKPLFWEKPKRYQSLQLPENAYSCYWNWAPVLKNYQTNS